MKSHMYSIEKCPIKPNALQEMRQFLCYRILTIQIVVLAIKLSIWNGQKNHTQNLVLY